MMTIRKIKYASKFCIPVILGGIFIFGTALGENISTRGWKNTGRDALLNIPAPADTKAFSHSKYKNTFLGSYSNNKDTDRNIENNLNFSKK
jgi:hypothetical protein